MRQRKPPKADILKSREYFTRQNIDAARYILDQSKDPAKAPLPCVVEWAKRVIEKTKVKALHSKNVRQENRVSKSDFSVPVLGGLYGYC